MARARGLPASHWEWREASSVTVNRDWWCCPKLTTHLRVKLVVILRWQGEPPEDWLAWIVHSALRLPTTVDVCLDHLAMVQQVGVENHPSEGPSSSIPTNDAVSKRSQSMQTRDVRGTKSRKSSAQSQKVDSVGWRVAKQDAVLSSADGSFEGDGPSAEVVEVDDG